MSVIVAIVGRPNSGKSTLFNKMKQLKGLAASAITEKIPGVTRDRNYGEAVWENYRFVVVDTGGFFLEDEMSHQVEEQALFAIEEADLIIHLMDGKEGLNPSDKELADILRRSGKRVLWVTNKIDTPGKEALVPEFYGTGAEDLIPVSAETGYGFDEFMDTVVSTLKEVCGDKFSESTAEGEESSVPRIAVVGKPNVGKSTLVNAFLGQKRHIVSPLPGTTRDAVDSVCTYYKKKYLFIDTAGMRKKADKYSIERFSVVRAMRSIERADVAVVVIDATQGIAEQDRTIAGLAEEYGKGVIFLLNKWDLVQDREKQYKEITTELKNKIWFMAYAPNITTSGLEKKRITKIFPVIDEIMLERKKRISTGELNRFLARAIAQKPFSLYKGKELKFFYVTQVGTEPPAFTVFVNYPAAVKEQYLRYLEKALRDEYSFTGTPIRIHVKSR